MDSVIGHERNQSLHDVHPVTAEVIEKNHLVRHFYSSRQSVSSRSDPVQV
jgi:hypothetical protein